MKDWPYYPGTQVPGTWATRRRVHVYYRDYYSVTRTGAATGRGNLRPPS